MGLVRIKIELNITAGADGVIRSWLWSRGRHGIWYQGEKEGEKKGGAWISLSIIYCCMLMLYCYKYIYWSMK